MDKRIMKRHKRKVAREREQVRTSEPDLRTEEQIQAAREASQGNIEQSHRGAHSASLATSFRGGRQTSTGSAAKTDA